MGMEKESEKTSRLVLTIDKWKSRLSLKTHRHSSILTTSVGRSKNSWLSMVESIGHRQFWKINTSKPSSLKRRGREGPGKAIPVVPSVRRKGEGKEIADSVRQQVPAKEMQHAFKHDDQKSGKDNGDQ